MLKYRRLYDCYCNLKKVVDGLPRTDATIMADVSSLLTTAVTGNANAINTNLTQTVVKAENGWTVGASVATFTGAPDFVEINISTWFEDINSAARQRIAPELELIRNTTVLARSGTAYQRHAADHDSSSNGISFVDSNPGTNPTYRLRSQRGSTQTEVVSVDIGSASFKAVNRVEVFKKD